MPSVFFELRRGIIITVTRSFYGNGENMIGTITCLMCLNLHKKAFNFPNVIMLFAANLSLTLLPDTTCDMFLAFCNGAN